METVPQKPWLVVEFYILDLKKGSIVQPGDSYFAGFFDGEGCIGIYTQKKSEGFVLTLQVTQITREVLDAFRNRWGGSIYGPRKRGGNDRPIYCWRIHAAKAEQVLLDLEPYVIVKRKQLRLALEFRKLFMGRNILPRGQYVYNSRKYEMIRDIMLSRRHKYKTRMDNLNKRGKDAA